jgi:DNA repair exonuclease SbcCD ATPase subunit
MSEKKPEPIGVAASRGDKAAITELARRGGLAKAQRERARKAEKAARVMLETVEARRKELSAMVASLIAAPIDEAKKTQALVQALRLMDQQDGYAALAKEVEQLRAEVTAYRAASLTADRAIVLRWADGTPIAPPLRIVPPVEAAE